MLCMYMGDAITLSDVPGGEIEWLKNLNIVRSFNLSMVFALDDVMFHTLDVVYVHGGCIDLVGCPLCGKIEWLKSLSISEGMIKIFNSSMVIVLDGAHVSCLI